MSITGTTAPHSTVICATCHSGRAPDCIAFDRSWISREQRVRARDMSGALGKMGDRGGSREGKKKSLNKIKQVSGVTHRATTTGRTPTQRSTQPLPAPPAALSYYRTS